MCKAQAIAEFSITTPGDSCKSRTLRLDASISTGEIVNYSWGFKNIDLGIDMGSGWGKVTTRNLLNPGLYEVTLKLLLANGSTVEKSKQVRVYELPIVDFEAIPNEGCRPQSIQFIDKSSAEDGTISKWEWNYSDGTSAVFNIATNPSHDYNASGKYTPSLIVTNSFGCTNSLAKPDYINIYDKITPTFIVSNNMSCSNSLTATFENTSPLDGPFLYVWDFGDGTKDTTSERMVKYFYSKQGVYVVRLTAVNKTGNCSSYSQTSGNRDVIIGKPSASFTIQSPICQNQTLTLSGGGDTTGISTTGRWIFGDNNTKNDGKSVSHKFSIIGTHTIKFVAFNSYSGCYSDTVYRIVEVLPVPTANFDVNNPFGCSVPHMVSFKNTSVDASLFKWNFGDGTPVQETTSGNDTMRTYTIYSNGISIRLVATNLAGCSNEKVFNYIQIQKPSIKFTADPKFGCKPLPVFFDATANSIDPVIGYVYDYGDGLIDTLKSATRLHSYRYAGTYLARVGIITSQGCVVYAETQTITVDDICNGNGNGNGGGGGSGGGIDGGWAKDCSSKYSFTFHDTLSGTEILYWIFDGKTVLTNQNPINYTFPNNLGYKKFLVTSVYIDTLLNDTLDNKMYITVVDEKAHFIPSVF
ncbi:MAG: PKD domain-containing protein [Bacteroidales bacterium]|nr:PKD domain-containing protein [Bacteroidales bacterium]